MIQRLFVYGSLAPGRPNEHVLSGIDGHWEAATVVGTLHQEGWGAAMGFPGIVLGDQGQEVEGFLFSSEQLADHWKRLDEFEGEGYERVLTAAKCKDATEVEAFVYALKDKSPES